MSIRSLRSMLVRHPAGIWAWVLLVACGAPTPPGASPRPPKAALSIDQVDVQPRVIQMPIPSYPGELQTHPESGWVDFEYIIGTDGRVERPSIRVVAASNPAFVPAATSTLERASFVPARKAGHAVRVVNRQRITFQLHGA
jgi:outer membrane biosynthesis protein TonB